MEAKPRNLEGEPGLETNPPHYISPLCPGGHPRSEEGMSSGQWWHQVVLRAPPTSPCIGAPPGWVSEPPGLAGVLNKQVQTRNRAKEGGIGGS